MFTVEAIIGAYNELDILQQSIAHLQQHGVRVYVMDNWSTDGTWEWLQKHGIAGEQWPPEGRPEKHSHTRALQRKEELFLLRKSDWCLHVDADELICSRVAGETLAQALERLDSTGANLVNCELLDFIPHKDGWKDEPVQEFFKRTQITAVNRLSYYRAWKNTGERVDLASSGGHAVQLPANIETRLSKETLLLKHYPFRSQEQATRKVFKERQGCWDPVEEAKGWHQHNYWYKPGHVFVKDVPVTLLTLAGFQDTFDQFAASVKKYKLNCSKFVVVSDALNLKAPGWTVLQGKKPFSFAGNVNVGMKAIPEGDILLSNDDVQFMQEGAVEQLRELAYSDSTIGVLAPQVHGLCGNAIQAYGRGQGKDLILSRERLAFICVYLKRSVIARIGLLDERFNEYGGEDTDWCIRAQQLGYRLMATPRVQVIHGFGTYPGTATFQRKGCDIGGGVARMEAKLQAKHAEVVEMGPGGYCIINHPVRPAFCCSVHERQWELQQRANEAQEEAWALNQ